MPSQQMPSPLKANVSLGSLSFRSLVRAPALRGLAGLGSNVSFKRRRTVVVGLDIQPGYVAAARAHVNGSLVVDQAATVALDADTVREGEVLNQEALSAALRELFARSGLDRHVRLGIANQRTVMRMLEVPPFSDKRDLDAAVRHQAEDEVPMPLATAVVDYRALGVVDTPQGARQRVLLVAAQRETVEKLLHAVKGAGLHPEGIDLSAFALIRSLYRSARDRPVAPDGEQPSAAVAQGVLHLNVGGLTNMVIAEGTNCRFARVLSRGLEAIAAEVAERRGVPIAQARELLRGAGMGAHVTAVPPGAGGLSGLGVMGSHADGVQDAEALAIQLDQERADAQAAEAAAAMADPAQAETGETVAPFDPAATAEVVRVEPLGAEEPRADASVPTATAPYADGELTGEVPGQVPAEALGLPAEQPPAAEGMAASEAPPASEVPAEGEAPPEGEVQVGFSGPGASTPVGPPSLTLIDGAGDAGDAGQPYDARVSPEVGDGSEGWQGTASEAHEGVHIDPAQADPGAQADPEAEADPRVQAGPAAGQAAVVAEPDPAALAASRAAAEELAEVRLVLESGVRAIAGEVRNSLDFFQAQEQGGGLGLVVVSGPALDIPGFAEVLEQNLGLPVASETVPAGAGALDGFSPQYFAIAAGLAVEEVQQ